MTTQGIGVMSGTSLDGIDLAWCRFSQDKEGTWNYDVLKSATYPYTSEFVDKLKRATEMSALKYCQLDIELGEVIALKIKDFIGNDGKPDFIASHGHTIFHQPAAGLTTQIGNGAVIAARTGITTVNDFRKVDVALQGQGAPLVPIGDELLFGQYDACLNLGGFSNISFNKQSRRIAFDISPCNMALNYIANILGKPYDDEGRIAQTGNVIDNMLKQLNNLPYYQQAAPKSLGKEWFEIQCLPILEEYLRLHKPQDCLRTFVVHIAQQISKAIPDNVKTMLVTGGGAFNKFLINQIKNNWTGNVCITDQETINYKEAIIFAFLGLLRVNEQTNTLASVTGATVNSCGGCIWKI